jgi:hypothetical protein
VTAAGELSDRDRDGGDRDKLGNITESAVIVIQEKMLSRR